MQVDDMMARWPLPKRRRFIGQLMNLKAGPTYSIQFQHQLQDLVIHRVPIELPVYRLGNGRTLARQQEYIAENQKAEDFFSRDPESIEALAAQHEILEEMVDKEDLRAYFREHEQNEPLVLTEDGHVVNGNRRLCAMRMLLSENPETFARFEHVRIVILPTCTEKEIDILEAEFQIQPDIKAKYTWIDRAMLLRDRQRTHNWSTADLARVHRLSETEVTNLIDLLDYADQYLAERGWQRQYRRILDMEYAFVQLQKGRKKLENEAHRDLFKTLTYIQLDQPDQAGRRLYEYIPDVQKNLPTIIKSLEEQLPNASAESTIASSPSPGSSVGDDFDLLGPSDGLSVPSNGHASAADLAKIVSDESNHDKVRSIVQDVVESARAQERARKSSNAVLQQVAAAHTSLHSAYTQIGPSANLKGIETHLDNIDDLVRKIRSKVSEYKSNDLH